VEIDLRGRSDNYPKEIIEILDTGNSAKSLEPLEPVIDLSVADRSC
jgi:hypothetical protein